MPFHVPPAAGSVAGNPAECRAVPRQICISPHGSLLPCVACMLSRSDFYCQSSAEWVSRDKPRAERAIPRSSMHHAIADPRRVRRACRPAPTRRVRRATVDLRNVSRYLSTVYLVLAPHPVARRPAFAVRCGRSVRVLRFATRRFSCVVCPVRAHTTPRSCGWCIILRSAVSIQLEF
jgi:hypothetical protein